MQDILQLCGKISIAGILLSSSKILAQLHTYCVFIYVFRCTDTCAFLQYVCICVCVCAQYVCVCVCAVHMCTAGLESMFPQPCSYQRDF